MNDIKANEQDEIGFEIKRPVQLHRGKKRQYVRLEIEAPITFARIDLDRPLEDLETHQIEGSILNISGGGVLIDSHEPVAEGEYLAMSFELRDYEMVSGVVGRVQRLDDDGEEGCLMGIEFCEERELISVFGEANVGARLASFDERVKRTILKYIFDRKVAERLNKGENE
ncbi:MAG: PilZ domain-containing protein, partial [bacterium]